MRIGNYEFTIKRIKNIYHNGFSSKAKLYNFIKKYVDPAKTEKLIIDTNKAEIHEWIIEETKNKKTKR